LINSATRECSTDPIHKVHLIWSNKNTTPVMELQNFMYTTSCTYRVPLWWFRTYSTLVQTYTYDLFFFTFWNSPALRWNSLYIWFEHYTHKVVGSRLFDHKKPIHMICALRSQCAGLGAVWPPKTNHSAGLFVRSAGLFLLTFFTFCYFLLHFLLLVTSVIYFFTIEGSLFVTICYFFYCLYIS